MTMTSTATASMWRRGWRRSPNPAASWFRAVVHDQVRDKLSFGFEDLGEQTVKNIARPIGVHRVSLAESTPRPWSNPPQRPLRLNCGPTDRPSIAVLPFANMSGDPEQEYFADGISEDIITGLSKLRWFFVIARNSSFAYKGKAVDVKRVARELGVRYVLEGSVRKGGNRVRITAQLIDAATSNHIWADRYDGDLTDVFALQDEITKKGGRCDRTKAAGSGGHPLPKSLARGSWRLGHGDAGERPAVAVDKGRH